MGYLLHGGLVSGSPSMGDNVESLTDLSVLIRCITLTILNVVLSFLHDVGSVEVLNFYKLFKLPR